MQGSLSNANGNGFHPPTVLSRAVNPSLVISAEECVMSLSGIALLFIPSGEKQSSCKPRIKVFFYHVSYVLHLQRCVSFVKIFE